MGILARRWITGQEYPTSVSRADKPRPINWLPAASSGQKPVLFVTGPVDLPRLKHFPQRNTVTEGRWRQINFYIGLRVDGHFLVRWP